MPLRVVLASSGPAEFAVLDEICRAAGHTPKAYVYSRSMRPGEPLDESAAATVASLVETVPTAVDLLLPAGPAGLGEALAGYRPDLMVIYGFNWLLPRSVYTVPRLGMLNVHPSLLPRYRGAAPVLWAIRNGDEEIGVTVHRVDDGADTGPILAQRGGVRLGGDLTPAVLRDRLAPVLREVLATAIARVAAGDPGRPQPSEGASHAPLMTPERRRLDWSKPAREIHHLVRLLRFMGLDEELVVRVGGQWLRMVRTSLTEVDGPRVQCGDGPLWIAESEPVPGPEQPAV